MPTASSIRTSAIKEMNGLVALFPSQFAGTADQMKEALIVNPLSRERVSEALERGLTMPLAERVRRWECLNDPPQSQDLARWRDELVACLQSTSVDLPRLQASPRIAFRL